jgi:hypothetical protein
MIDWDMSVCHTYYGVGYKQGNIGDYVWDAPAGPPPPPPQCPPIAFMCPLTGRSAARCGPTTRSR